MNQIHNKKMDTFMYNSKKAWFVTSILFIGQVINYLDKSVIGLAAVPIMRDLKITPQQYGFIASSFFSLYAISGVFAGMFVAQRVRSKTLLSVLVLIWSLSQLPVVLFGSLTTLVACRVVLGIGEGPATPSATSACHEWFTADQRNMPTAFLMLGASIGSLVAGPLLSYTIIAHGWRSAFLLCGVLGGCWVVLWQVFGATGPGSTVLRPRLAEAAAPSPSSGRRIGQGAIWSDPTILGIIVVGFTAYWSTGFTLAWLAPLVRSGLGYDAATTGWIVAGVAGVNSIILLLVSYISQAMLKRGRSSRLARGVVNALCMLAAAGALAGVTMVADPILKLVLLAVGGALPTVTFVLGPALVSEITPPYHRSRFLITISAGITVAGFLAPLVAGQLIGNAGVEGYNHALLANAMVVAIGGLTGFWLLRPDRSIRRFAAMVGAAV